MPSPRGVRVINVEDMCYEIRRAGTREEPGTSTQGAPVFPGSSRLGIEPKTPGTGARPNPQPIGDLEPTQDQVLKKHRVLLMKSLTMTV